VRIIRTSATGKAARGARGLLTGCALDGPADPWTVCAARFCGGAPPRAHSPKTPACGGPLRRPGRVAARARAVKSAATRLASLGPAGPLLTARPHFADCGSQGLRCAQTCLCRACPNYTARAGAKKRCSAAQSRSPITPDHPRSPSFRPAPGGQFSTGLDRCW